MVHIDEAVVAEIREAFRQDGTRLGEIWRADQEGRSSSEIALSLGTQTSQFVWKYLRFARAIETGQLPSAPSIVRECRTAMRGFLNRHSERLSPATKSLLEERIALLEAMQADTAAEEQEDHEVRQRTRRAEQQRLPGVYVYTLPHYFRHPMQPSPDDVLAHRTLMKVGMSESDVIKRFISQERNTALPEDPWLLRIYTGPGNMYEIEQSIHGLLRAADHRQSVGRSSGTEWFLTSLRFLDALAADKGLSTHFALDEAMGPT